MPRFQEWLKALEDPTKYAFLTCGDWDLKTMLPQQLAYTASIHPDFSLAIPPLVNIKKSFRRHYKFKKGGMKSMLSYMKLELEGKHHSGIDERKNISRMVTKLMQEKWDPGHDLR
jgi:ERI1 exoribonuclease 3